MSDKLELQKLAKSYAEAKREAQEIVSKAIEEHRQTRQEAEGQSSRQD